jgi:outer membrane protein OmpA-like peptidoglycan-associated protein
LIYSQNCESDDSAKRLELLESREKVLVDKEHQLVIQELLLVKERDALAALMQAQKIALEQALEVKAEQDRKLAQLLREEEDNRRRREDETFADVALRKKTEYERALTELQLKQDELKDAARVTEQKQQSVELFTHDVNLKRIEYESAQSASQQRVQLAAAIISKEIEEVMKEQIEFEPNHPDLTPQGEAICNRVVPFLLRVPHMPIYIDSHTSCQPGRCDNGCSLMDLSQKRVDIVKKYFEARGCSNIFICKGWGCKHPEYLAVRLVRIHP